MPRLSADLWAAARIKWEADPTLTFVTLGKELGLSDEGVRKRCKAEQWERRPDLRTLADLAHARSDAREVGAKVGAKVGSPTSKSRDAAVDIRADVIDRHKADWAEHRQHFTIGAIAKNFDLGKSAKISSEMLLNRQKGECDAYGLNAAGTQQAPAEPEWAVLIGQKVVLETDA